MEKNRFGRDVPSLSYIVASKIMGKAVLAMPEGGVKLVVVFATSTYHNFYYIFTAPSARSARKNWKYTGKLSVYGVSFHGAIERVRKDTKQLAVAVKRIYPVGKRVLGEFINGIEHPIHKIPTELPAGASVELVNKRMDNGRRGRMNTFLSSRR